MKNRQFSNNTDNSSFIDILVILILVGISIGIAVLGNYLGSLPIYILGLFIFTIITGVSVIRFISAVLDLTDRLKQR